MKFHKFAFVLLIIGGLNWLLVVFGYGIGNYIPSGLANVIYALVGLAAISEVVAHKKLCKMCSGQM